MTMYLCLEDQIVKRAREKRIVQNTRYITNAVLFSGFALLMCGGVIGVKFIGECIAIGCVNKITKVVIKKVENINKKISN